MNRRSRWLTAAALASVATVRSAQKPPVLALGGMGRTGVFVATRLSSAVYPVRVMTRSPGRARPLFDRPIEIIDGDLREPGTLPGKSRCGFGRT